MAVPILNTNVPMLEQRTKINEGFAMMELKENKTSTITSVASVDKFPNEKAVYDYVQKTYYSTNTPVTKPGDLLFLETATGKGKIKYNVSGNLKEMVPDRSIADTKTAAQLASLNATLTAGEIVVESDTRLMKVGDGSKSWSALPYHSGIKYGSVADQHYIKYANGMIMQYGSFVVLSVADGSIDSLITMPIPFTDVTLGGFASAYINDQNWDGAASKDIFPRIYSASQYRFVCNGGLVANGQYRINYLIVGF